MFTFEIDMDASGARDQVQLPADAPIGCRSLKIRPPTGHAWSYSAPAAASTAVTASTDEEMDFRRSDAQPAYQPGENLPLFVALDTGSGTGLGTLV